MFEGFELDDAAAAAESFATTTLSTFKNGLGKISSSAKSYSGERWLLGTEIGGDLVTAAAARLELLPNGLKCRCGSGFTWLCPFEVDAPLLSISLNPVGSEVGVVNVAGWRCEAQWEEHIEGRRVLVGGGTGVFQLKWYDTWFWMWLEAQVFVGHVELE